MEISIRSFRQHSGYEPAMDLRGFAVQATDGRIGTVGEHDPYGRADSRHLVVDTGVRTLHRHVLIPVRAIVSIDLTDEVVHVDRTRAEIERSGAGIDRQQAAPRHRKRSSR